MRGRSVRASGAEGANDVCAIRDMCEDAGILHCVFGAVQAGPRAGSVCVFHWCFGLWLAFGEERKKRRGEGITSAQSDKSGAEGLH
jgi:hypothetical protein